MITEDLIYNRDVVKARNVPVPTEPLVFLKPTSSYLREGQPIIVR